MRIEVAAAYAMGVGLPLLEALRRKTHFSPIAAYADDFIAGGLLLAAAWAVSRGKPQGPALLVAAWGILCGGLYSSFFTQLARDATHDISGLPNTTVVLIKGALFAISIAALVLSIRTASTARDPT